MSEKEVMDRFAEERHKARKESDFVRQIRAKTDLSDAKTALKLYNKLIHENYFNTIVGYAFLEELRDTILEENAAAEEKTIRAKKMWIHWYSTVLRVSLKHCVSKRKRPANVRKRSC